MESGQEMEQQDKHDLSPDVFIQEPIYDVLIYEQIVLYPIALH